MATVMKVCEALNIDIEALAEGKVKEKAPAAKAARAMDKNEFIKLLHEQGFLSEGEELGKAQLELLDSAYTVIKTALSKQGGQS